FSMLFVFKSVCAHPVLHSFPTRRSSDLQFLEFFLRDARRAAAGHDLRAEGQRDEQRGDHSEPSTYFGLMRRIDSSAASLTSGTSDRKSTRLNSSHDQISYAVFCLKKKK